MEATARGNVLFAGGGTGGHLSPGLAIAEALHVAIPEVGRLFACSTRTIDQTMLEAAGEKYVPVPAKPFGVRPRPLARFVRGWQRSRKMARRILRDERVDVVVALGGYAAAPTVSAAASLGVPVILLNLDAVPGKANRAMAGCCTQILSTCPTPGHTRFGAHQVSMPLRQATIAPGPAAECRKALGLDPDSPVLLITGASQGSASLNNLMAELAGSYPEVLAGWQIHHLTGPDRPQGLGALYSQAGLTNRVEPFLQQMGLGWGAADLAISRAGANSVAEIAANAVPTVFLPYPHHRDRHQHANAQPLVAAGGAVVLDDLTNPHANLSAHLPQLKALLSDSSQRTRMRQALLSTRRKNGAATVVEVIRPYLTERPMARSPES